MSLLAQQNLQQLGAQMFGLDPFIVIGVWTVGFAGLGWLGGPLVGGTVFRVVHRNVVGEMASVSVVLLLLFPIRSGDL